MILTSLEHCKRIQDHFLSDFDKREVCWRWSSPGQVQILLRCRRYAGVYGPHARSSCEFHLPTYLLGQLSVSLLSASPNAACANVPVLLKGISAAIGTVSSEGC